MTQEDREEMTTFLRNNLRLKVEERSSYTGDSNQLYKTYYDIELTLEGIPISSISIEALT